MQVKAQPESAMEPDYRSSLSDTRTASSETLHPFEKSDGMFVDGLTSNSCCDEVRDGIEHDSSDFSGEIKDASETDAPTDSNALTNSERTLEKW